MSARLTDAQDATLEKILHHLSELNRKSHFAERLAKENHLDLGVTYSLITEYAKYLFIVREGGHPVSPPPLIDKAWHLHLLYTEAYWNDLCPNILGMPLHHTPATGSAKEAAKFTDWAAQTLESYRKFFGDPPPLWLAPGAPVDRPIFRNIGYALAGAALGLWAYAICTGHPLRALAVGVPVVVASFLCFGTSRDTLYLPWPMPKQIQGPKTSAKCSTTTCATSAGGGGGFSCSGGGH